ncbi:unnamed protein product [Polarella glacialis]|uniref:Uncharacterized protein n=1 Tax=Polarella glacialis TaxID=89957 RepID=A0A813G6W6_POLGL|nr:unnamed protein product [Polarella glacialis]CAE8738121.1 unnamed protein product [Polarella glacialis]
MEQACKLIKKIPVQTILGLLNDAVACQAIAKKVIKLVKKGKISPQLVQETSQKVKLRKEPPQKVKQPRRKQTTTTGSVGKLTFSSPAIEDRLEGDPYDDSLMDEFGELAEHFGCHEGKKDEIHKTQKGAMEAAWEFVQACGCDDGSFAEFAKELAEDGTWTAGRRSCWWNWARRVSGDLGGFSGWGASQCEQTVAFLLKGDHCS